MFGLGSALGRVSYWLSSAQAGGPFGATTALLCRQRKGGQDRTKAFTVCPSIKYSCTLGPSSCTVIILRFYALKWRGGEISVVRGWEYIADGYEVLQG